MEMTQHALTWFEIPVSDFERAKAFYSAIFDYEMQAMPMGTAMFGFLPHDREKGGIGGAIVHGEAYQPHEHGTKVYLSAGADLSKVLDRVEAAGGKIAIPKTQISPEMGYFAFFEDTEGNHVGLHSRE